MITSKEALAITQESWRKTFSETLEPMIKKAAEKGYRKLELSYEIDQGTEFVLKECGYDFDYNGEVTTIWW